MELHEGIEVLLNEKYSTFEVLHHQYQPEVREQLQKKCHP